MIKVGDRAYTDRNKITKTSTTSSSGASATNDQFMSLLLAQLKNQNPLEPMDDTEMVNQMVTMNSLDELQKISKALTSMTQTNQFVSAASLIDKTVTYLNEDNEVNIRYRKWRVHEQFLCLPEGW